MQNRDLWLRPLLEGHRQREKDTNHISELWDSDPLEESGWGTLVVPSHLGLLVCVKAFLDLVFIHITESSDLKNEAERPVNRVFSTASIY